MDQEKTTEALDRDGFAVFERCVPEALLCVFEKEVGEFSSASGRRIGVEGNGDAGLLGVFRRGGNFRSICYQMIQGLPALRQIGNHLAESPAIGALLQHYQFKLPAFSQSMRVDIPDEADFLLPPHQDYAGMRSHKALRFWLPLRDADESSGTMAVYPGTHRAGVLDHSAGDARYPAVPDAAIGAAPKVVEAVAGTGVLFDMFLVHKSIPNNSDKIKFTLTFTIQDLAALADPDDGTDPVAQYFHLHRARTEARGSGT